MSDEEIAAPELYGYPLLIAAKAMDYIPFVRQKVASDALMHSTRERTDIREHPTMLPLPLRHINPNQGACDSPSIPRLDPNHRSVSPFLSFWDYHEAYLQSKTTPSKVAQRLKQKLTEARKMNWVRFVVDDLAEQARESTERYKAGAPISQMDGVFVTIKEELDIKGLETKVGTCFVNDNQPATEDATLVTKLKKAGAIVVGSAVMNELGWDTFSVNPNTGVPKNPYGAAHSCGGSSGGSGGCVASGLVPVSIGADGGGSVRIPSSFCGLYGLKTTYARVSGYGGAPIDPSLGTYGPIAATADDMALTYSIIAGPDSNDPMSLLQPTVSLKDYDRYQDLSDLTIGVFPSWARNSVEPSILEKVDFFQQALGKLGAKFIEIEIPDLDLSSNAHTVTICSEMYNFASSHKENHHRFLAHTRLMIGTSSTLDGRDYVRAQQIRTRMMNHMERLFEKVDLILCPTTALVSPLIPEKAHQYGMSNAKMTIQSMIFCKLGNLTGIPAVSVPAGFNQDMPIGLQFMAGWHNEALLCRIAKACERLPGIERKHPKDIWFADELLQ
ncbi:Fatty acid amide hydrolase [Choanephora cucurbitarum]|uniref:Fatty acid amide hydrolase n=1 Tax=Choanephora cucurbitarum TaxID=101091 RepID=A0A1C7N7W4_9FUNG|nr:Fatty acid amide hydrolase [Choanephora cucurbitarum]